MSDRTMMIDGVRVPRFLYGTAWKADQTTRLTALAVGQGFRGIDTANQRKHYHESGVGRGIAEVVKSGLVARDDLVRQANWQKVGGASPPDRRSNRTTFLREPCVGSREGAGEASVAAWMGRAIEHRQSDGPGCRGFQIGRRQYRRRRFGEMSASPAVSENPCTFARLLLGPWEVFKLPRLS